MERWSPKVELTKQEQMMMKRLTRVRALFGFLRLHRHELFDAAFQDQLAEMYRDTGAGDEPHPPARERKGNGRLARAAACSPRAGHHLSRFALRRRLQARDRLRERRGLRSSLLGVAQSLTRHLRDDVRDLVERKRSALIQKEAAVLHSGAQRHHRPKHSAWCRCRAGPGPRPRRGPATAARPSCSTSSRLSRPLRSRIDWRSLLKRSFDVDLRVCVRCGGKLTVRAVFTDPASVAKLLAALRRPRALHRPQPDAPPGVARHAAHGRCCACGLSKPRPSSTTGRSAELVALPYGPQPSVVSLRIA